MLFALLLVTACKQYAASVTISGLEMLQNSGKEAIIDLIDSRMDIAEAQMANRIDTDLYLDGKHTSAVVKAGYMLETPAKRSVVLH